MVTGGQRSGKSELAERIALQLSDNPLYIATAMVTDDEMARRVEVHRQRRGHKWRLAEEQLWPSRHISSGDTALHYQEDADKTLDAVRSEIARIASIDGATVIAVTNEIGLGGISPNPLQRKFTDLHGMANRCLADNASEVYMTLSGIPVKIK